MLKKTLGIGIIVVFGVCMLVVPAHACSGKGREKSSHFSLEEKVLKKAHFLMKNQEEIGLSDEQVESIKVVKMATKKALIKQGAEIELISLDMKSELYKDVVNEKALKKIVDKKYDLKKAKMNMLVDAYIKIKGELNDAQRQMMKEIWKKKKAEMGGHGGKMGCPMMMKK